MEIGTLVIGVPFMITVAVPLYLVATLVKLPRDVEACPALTDILKSFMVCIWGSLPFSIAILNVELNVGEFVFIFLKSHAPESIHAGFPFLPFCILAIVPVAALSTEHLAPAIDAILADTIITTVAATTITIVGLAIKACLFFCNIKRHSITCYKHYLCRNGVATKIVSHPTEKYITLTLAS